VAAVNMLCSGKNSDRQLFLPGGSFQLLCLLKQSSCNYPGRNLSTLH